MSSRFKNTTGAFWKTLVTPATEWLFDTQGVTPKFLECTLEYLECEMGSYRSLVASLEYLECTGVAYNGPTGNLDCDIDYLTCVMQGTFIPPITGDIEAQLEYLIFEGTIMNSLESTFEYMTCGMDSLFGADIEGSFKELDLLGVARHCKTDLLPLLKKLDCEMYSGVEVVITLEKPQMTGRLFQNIEGEMQSAFQTMTFEARSGAYLMTEFESIGFTGQASIPILGHLNIQTRSLQCEMLATTESVDILIATLRSLTMTGAATASTTIGTDGDIVATMKRMEAVITGINGQVCDLEGTIPKLIAEMLSGTDEANIAATLELMTTQFEVNEVSMEASFKPLTAEFTSKFDHLTASLKPITGVLTGYETSQNHLVIEFQDLTLTMFSFTLTPPDGETCEPYKTLEYEETV